MLADVPAGVARFALPVSRRRKWKGTFPLLSLPSSLSLTTTRAHRRSLRVARQDGRASLRPLGTKATSRS